MKTTTNILKKVILIISVLLTGCAGMNSNFDCNAGPGGSCQPMDQINKEANSGAFNAAPIVTASQTNTALGYPFAAYKGQPIRIGESVQRIWIAPFEDQDGNYHEPSYVYTVVQKGHWLGSPVKEIAAGE